MDHPRPTTEDRNPRTVDIDQASTAEVLHQLHEEDAWGVAAVTAATEDLTAAVEAARERLLGGGRVHYFGAGASGRLAVLDATEITPTFGTPPDLFTAHFPGGSAAVTDSSLDFEDAEAMGSDDARVLNPTDVAVGITASGTTPYVAGALRRAGEVGALRVLVTCSPASPLRELSEVAVTADTGPEALTGSTRLKAGTATKVALNSFSTALMIRTGRTYSNLMVGLVASNAKLRARAVEVLVAATEASHDQCAAALAEAGGELRTALVGLRTGAALARVRDALEQHGTVRGAIAALGGR